MSNKVKATLLSLLGIGTAYAAGTAYTATQINRAESKLEAQLAAEQDAYFAANGKYKIIPSSVTPEGIRYRVDTVVVWDGKATPKDQGYQIYIMKPDFTQKSSGKGLKSSEFSHDWKTLTTSTSTITRLK